MGLKSELKQILRVYGEHKNNVDQRIQSIKKDDRYSDEYKKVMIENIKQEGNKGKQQLSDAAVKAINSYKENLINSRKPINKDLAFELRLNNALKTIELAGKEMKPEELARIVEPFKEDFDTMQTIRHIFNAQGINAHEVIPVDDAESQIKSLDYVKDLMVHCLNPDIEHSSSDDLAMNVAVEMIGDGVIGIPQSDGSEGAEE